jgi:hypothetical protein
MAAQILILYDQKVKIGPGGDQRKLEIGAFAISDLNTDVGMKAILLFKVQAVGAAILTMKLNNATPVVDAYSFNPPEPDSMRARSWHETFVVTRTEHEPTNTPPHLKQQGNHLVVSATGSGYVEISDIVLLYHAN